MNRTESHDTRHHHARAPLSAHPARRTRAALTALGVACGLLLTACSGTGDGQATHDRAREGAGRTEAGPGPGPAPGDERGDTSREFAPSPDPDPDPDHLSTFALDVDTASYGYARRTLAEERLPEPSTIRPEEFVNSFRQDYERPDGDGFTVTVDGARTTDEDWSLLRVGLATRARPSEDRRPPAALTFVVDISGSMADPGRLDLVQDALGVMTDRLRDDDSVALVTFSDEAETVLPMTRLGGHRGRVHDAVRGLEPEQSTNLGAGVETGYATAVEGLRRGATNRVVLLSDALANTGDTDADTILERVADARRTHGITLFGVGVGSEYGDALMERLADRGDGHTTYVSTPKEARALFSDELPRNVDLVARDAKAQVAFDPETVEEFRLIGYGNRRVADEDFRDDRVDGGEVGPGHTVTALYAVRVKEGARGHLATATVRWQDPDTRTPHEESGELEAGALHDGLWTSPEGLRLAAVAAYFADALRRGDDHWTHLPGNPSLARLADEAQDIARDREDEDVADLARTIRTADRMLT